MTDTPLENVQYLPPADPVPTPTLAFEDLPVLRFPRYVALGEKHLPKFANLELGGVKFVDGRSPNPVSFRVAAGLSIGFELIDQATGLTLHPIHGERKTYMVDFLSKAWTPYAGMPEHVAEQRDAIKDRTGYDYDAAAAAAAAKNAPALVAPQAPVLPPADADVAEVIGAVLKAKGARYLRQIAESRGLKPPRSGDETAAMLAEALTLEEAKALLDPAI